MKIQDEVLEKFGDLAIDLGKTAMIAGMAALFFERFRFITAMGGSVVGLFLIYWGLYCFHVLARRKESVNENEKNNESEFY